MSPSIPTKLRQRSPMELFVNRESLRGTLKNSALSIDGRTHQVLVIHSVSGQGKSLLSKQFGQDVRDDLSLNHIRSAALNLADSDNLDPIFLLVRLRNAVVRSTRMSASAFDIGFELYWREAYPNQISPVIEHHWLDSATEIVGEGGKDTALFFTGLLAEAGKDTLQAASLIPGMSIATFILRKLGGRVIRKGYEAFLYRTTPALQHLFSKGELLSPHEIEQRLGSLLAWDIAAWSEDHPDLRLLITIDEYERALEFGGASDLWRNRGFDTIIQDLAASCPSTLFVFFSREKLRWDRLRADEWTNPLIDRQIPLDGLSQPDAALYLEKTGITDREIQSAIIIAASSAESSMTGVISAHPYMLFLQAQIFEQYKNANKTLEPDIFRCVLWAVDLWRTTRRAMSRCPA